MTCTATWMNASQNDFGQHIRPLIQFLIPFVCGKNLDHTGEDMSLYPGVVYDGQKHFRLLGTVRWCTYGYDATAVQPIEFFDELMVKLLIIKTTASPRTWVIDRSIERVHNLTCVMLQPVCCIPIALSCSSVDIRGVFSDTLCDFFFSETFKESK
jgi:hypothetical protein